MDKEQKNDDFYAIIVNYPVGVQKLAIELREVIFNILPETIEVSWVNQKVTGFGVGPKKMSEHFCYMVFAKGHINFGFNHGTNLKDPKGLLGGTGKAFRNTKIKTMDEVHHPDLADLIVESIAERRKSLSKIDDKKQIK